MVEDGSGCPWMSGSENVREVQQMEDRYVMCIVRYRTGYRTMARQGTADKGRRCVRAAGLTGASGLCSRDTDVGEHD